MTRPRSRLIVIVFATLVGALGGGLWLAMEWWDYREAISDARRSADGAAALMEENTQRALDGARLILTHVADQAREHGFRELVDSEAMGRDIREMAASLPLIGRVRIAAFSELAGPTAEIGATVVGSVTVEPGTGKRRLSVWRALTNRSEPGWPEVAVGWAVADIDLDALRLFHRPLIARLGEGGEAVLGRDDGTLILRTPVETAAAAGARAFLEGRESRVSEEASPFDGVERVLARRPVGDGPLVVAAGIARATALGEWSDRLEWSALLFGVALVSFIAFTTLTLVGIAREAAARRAAVRDNESLEERVGARTAELRAARDDAMRESNAKSQFLANVSHELRTPLNAVIGFSELLSSGFPGPLTDKQSQYLETIHQSGSHLLRIINDILDLSKISAERLELEEQEIQLALLVQSSLDIVRGRTVGRDLALIVEAPADLPALWGDELRLRQILINLLSNAIKFTEDPGAVRVRAERTADGGLELSVQDSGVGMDAEEIPRALSMFGQLDNSLARRHEGTGIGLSIVKGLTELHGGTVEIESARGAGTTVRLRFPPERVMAHLQTAGGLGG